MIKQICCDGWLIWNAKEVKTLRPVRVWVACATCNDDEHKPKPECCEGCGETKHYCFCKGPTT